MKIHLILSEEWASMKNAVIEANEYLKVFGITVTSEQKKVDVSSPDLYETAWSWSKLKYVPTKSMKPAYIYGLASKEYQDADCIGLLIDKNKAFEEERLRGQQSTFNGKQVLELYCLDSKEKLFGFPRNTYITIHELLHALADHHKVEDTLHSYLDTNTTLDGYKWLLLGRCVKNSLGLLPSVYDASQRLVAYAESIGTPIRITEGYRSPERQNELYNQRPKVTNAKAWESMHQYRVAFDIVFIKEGYNASTAQWKTIGEHGKKLGFTWGGDWKDLVDKPHFELTYGKSLKDFQKNTIDWTKYWTIENTSYTFTTDLYLGIDHPEVKELQKFLNTNGFPIAIWGNGSPGNETTFFGEKTQKALIKFQKASGISPAVGYMGIVTRSFISKMV